ncbi:hypothetical protein HMPREF3086_04985 [Dietzia sp. HMSC21D01]|nr:hypothetical protein HMPREF3086_04985 [Dietzia sp. HMSC21D01]
MVTSRAKPFFGNITPFTWSHGTERRERQVDRCTPRSSSRVRVLATHQAKPTGISTSQPRASG